jgi:hypothetical protein
MKGRTVACPPPAAPAMSDNDGAPVRGLSHRESHSGRGPETGVYQIT